MRSCATCRYLRKSPVGHWCLKQDIGIYSPEWPSLCPRYNLSHEWVATWVGALLVSVLAFVGLLWWL